LINEKNDESEEITGEDELEVTTRDDKEDIDSLLDEDIEDEEDIGEEEKIQKEDDFDSEDKEEREEKRPFVSAFWDIMKDVIIAFIIVLIIISSIYIYTGNWPPVVVVESDSMQHSDDESFLGVIDTGDLVLVKSIDSEDDVISYIKGKRIGHETYNEYGDVLIYRKNGFKDSTPVIHRALIWVEYNQTGNSFDIPELQHHKVGLDGDWYTLGSPSDDRWYNLRGTLVLRKIGYDEVDVNINLNNIILIYNNPQIEPHSGFITLGDHNGANYDQNMLQDEHGGKVRPVTPEWVVGKARGELPWFGLIKLYFQDNSITDRAPANSWTMLWITLILIFAIPISIDITLILLERRKEKMGIKDEGEESKEELEEEEPPPPEDIEEEEPPPPDDFDEDELPPPDD
jgi:signal peptidase